MTADQQKNYEAAAREYSRADIFPDHVHQASYRAFLAGCAHASKEAHNAAIQKTIDFLQALEDTAYPYIWAGIKIELEKLKL